MVLTKRTADFTGFPEWMIIETVSDFFRTPKKLMLGHSRLRHLVIPRHIAMYLLRKHTHLSLEEIGKMFGGRDHTTILHAVRSTRTTASRDEEIAAQIRWLDSDLRKRRVNSEEELSRIEAEREIENLVGLA